ncbi:uncharacterized protein [Elaeis guineensis]|uniref:uncharacterized protein n=1 Tax=Elaeis guineensis var. tenera TaxID=51953 RepID=UPI003C6DACA4
MTPEICGTESATHHQSPLRVLHRTASHRRHFERLRPAACLFVSPPPPINDFFLQQTVTYPRRAITSFNAASVTFQLREPPNTVCETHIYHQISDPSRQCAKEITAARSAPSDGEASWLNRREELPQLDTSDVLNPIKEQFPILSYRDFYQLAVVVAVEVTGVPAIPVHRGTNDYQAAVNQCKEELHRFIAVENCAPLMLRIAWHLAGRMRFQVNRPRRVVNNDLHDAFGRLEGIKRRFPMLSDGDFYQLAGVVAFEVTGGPEIHFHPGSENLARRVEELEESDEKKAKEILDLKASLKRNGEDFQNLVRRVRMLEESNNKKHEEILTLKALLTRI